MDVRAGLALDTMNGQTTFRDKMKARDSAPFCSFSTTQSGSVSCLVNL